MKYHASIIIASHNSKKTIRQCLRSLLEQDFLYPYEIIVVDSSSDSTPEIIANEFPHVRLMHFNRKMLPGRSRNIGIKASSGDIILFLPADCFVLKNWLSERFKHHARGFSVVSSSIDNGNPDRTLGWVEFLVEYTRQMFTKKDRQRIINNKGFLFLSYTRKVFGDLGPYPEELFSHEDTTFVTKIINSNIPIFYDPAIRFFHINSSSLFESFRHQYIHGFDAGTMTRNHDLIDSNYPFKFLLPIYFPIIKWMIIFYRVARKRPCCLSLFFILSPIIILVLFTYSVSYFYGFFFRKI